MTAFPPLDVRLQGARLSCVIDLRLALSRSGLMFAWRLSEELDVWLYRSFWALLDDAQCYLEEPEALLGGAARGIGAPLDLEIAADALSQWEPARLEDNVPSFPFYYVGDLRYESHLPRGADADLIRRFDLLSRSLGQRLDVAEEFQPQIECWRDAAALHAALAHRQPLIMTVYEQPHQAPALCQFLARAGLDCRRMEWRADANPMHQHLLPMLIRTGAAELVWAGLPLAAVHIVAPRAFTIPRPKDEDDRGSLDRQLPRGGSSVVDEDPWRDAVCLWYPLQ